jgi:hypothetical protein
MKGNQMADVLAWNDYLKPFAEALGIEVAVATDLLKSVVGEAGDRAMAILKDVNLSPDADIKAVLPAGTPSGVANQAISLLREVRPAMDSSAVMFGGGDSLPTVPDDNSWLETLKVGGILKFNPATAVGTVSAGLADQVGLFDLPKRIVDAMEAHAESLDEPVPAEYFELQRSLTERSYAELFAAIPGATGRYATQARKTALLQKINTMLWPSLLSFQNQLSNWLDSWQRGMSNPAMIAQVVMSSRMGGPMPPNLMAPPSTSVLRDAAEGVIDSINRIFAGVNIPVAMALAYDAQQIRKALENSNLPAHLGAANREQMLKKLGAAVTSDYSRLERDLKKFTLGIIELPNVTSGQAELNYITDLYQVGAMIPWDKLGGVSSASGGRGRGRSDGVGRFGDERMSG